MYAQHVRLDKHKFMEMGTNLLYWIDNDSFLSLIMWKSCCCFKTISLFIVRPNGSKVYLLLQEQRRFWYFSRWACYNQKKMAFSQCLTSVISCISTSNGILVWPHTKREYSEALLHYLVQHWDLMKWINWSNKAERSPVWDWEETQIPGRFLYGFDPL